MFGIFRENFSSPRWQLCGKQKIERTKKAIKSDQNFLVVRIKNKKIKKKKHWKVTKHLSFFDLTLCKKKMIPQNHWKGITFLTSFEYKRDHYFVFLGDFLLKLFFWLDFIQQQKLSLKITGKYKLFDLIWIHTRLLLCFYRWFLVKLFFWRDFIQQKNYLTKSQTSISFLTSFEYKNEIMRFKYQLLIFLTFFSKMNHKIS